MNEPDDSILTLDDVTVGYDHHVVLADVKLALQRGGFSGLLGANGSGKSTLINTILGDIAPSRVSAALAPVSAVAASVRDALGLRQTLPGRLQNFPVRVRAGAVSM